MLLPQTGMIFLLPLHAFLISTTSFLFPLVLRRNVSVGVHESVNQTLTSDLLNVACPNNYDLCSSNTHTRMHACTHTHKRTH